MYDKRDEFKQLNDTILKDVRRAFNRAGIPFLWIAPVYDDGKGTKYRVAMDTNKEIKENIQYACDALTPGSMGMDLKDDLIRDIIKVMNGYKVVTDYNPIVLNEGELTNAASALAKTGLPSSMKDDGEGGFYLDVEDDAAESETDSNVASAGETMLEQVPVALHRVIEPVDQNGDNQIHVERSTFLPYIPSDFDDEDDQEWFASYNLLTAKPTIYAANVAEDDLADDGASNPHVAKVREMAKEEGAEVFVICAQIEQELAELDEDEKKEYLDDLGVTSSGLDKLVAASYSLLGLISFLTAGEDECRAWTIKKGTKAPQAAGKIHTDFERGFIKAEVVNYQDLLDNGSLAAAREKGIVGMEGKEYVVKDGDVILFRFNV